MLRLLAHKSYAGSGAIRRSLAQYKSGKGGINGLSCNIQDATARSFSTTAATEEISQDISAPAVEVVAAAGEVPEPPAAPPVIKTKSDETNSKARWNENVTPTLKPSTKKTSLPAPPKRDLSSKFASRKTEGGGGAFQRKEPPSAARISSFMNAFTHDAYNERAVKPVVRPTGVADNAAAKSFPKRSDQQIQAEIRQSISRAIAMKNGHAILQAVKVARSKNIELSAREYLAVLWACEQLPTGDPRYEFAVWTYYSMKKQSAAIPTEVYERVAAVCARTADSRTAMELYRDIHKGGITVTEKLMVDIVTAVASDSNVPTHIIDDVYKKYCEYAQKSEWKGSNSMYSQVAGAYSRAKQGQSAAVLSVLKQMTQAHHEPSLALCTYIMENALWYGKSHVEVLRVLSTWCLLNFKVKLDRGVIDRMMQLGATCGNDMLIQTCIQLLQLAGHPVGQISYACWLRACLQKQDLVGAVEALISAETNGLDMLEVTPAWGGGERLQHEITTCLMMRASTIDNVYFALVDLVRGNYKVPSIMLNSIIMSSGYLGFYDRAFGTFSELESLFAIKPDVHTYNALLWANAKCLPRASRNITSDHQANLDILLRIMQNMEEVGKCTPNSYTFDILLDYMAETSTAHYRRHLNRETQNLSFYDRPQLRPQLVSKAQKEAEAAMEAASGKIAKAKITDPGGLTAKNKGPQMPEAGFEIPGFDQLLSHVIANNITLSNRTLRRVARASAYSGNTYQTEAVVRLLVKKSGSANIPKFFVKQMDAVNAAAAAKAASTPVPVAEEEETSATAEA